jgi:hypothetical protein
LKELRRKLQEEHGSRCIKAVNDHAEITKDNAPAASQDALRTMMDLSEARKCLQKATLEWKNVKERADKINKEALELQKLVEQAEQEVQTLQAQLHAKRARTEAQEEEEQDDIEVGDWTLPKFRSEASRVQNRRNTKLGSRDTQPTYRSGGMGYLRHPRLGLIGWVAYWSRGHTDTAIKMIVQLIVQLDINERVQDALPSTTDRREAEINAKIVDLLVAAMCETKKCKSEQQRKEYLIGLAYVMPPRMQQGERGWIQPICDRLNVQRGKRSSSLGARARASDQSVDRRAEFDQDIQKQLEPLLEGDTALSDGYECEITQIGGNYQDYGEEGPPCKIMFKAQGFTQQYDYDCMFGKRQGSARLQRPPPTLSPDARVVRHAAVSAKHRLLVKEHVYEVCSESPCKRDAMRKHVAPRVWEQRQALILTPCR